MEGEQSAGTPLIPYNLGVWQSPQHCVSVGCGESYCASGPSGFPHLGQHPCLMLGTHRSRSVRSRTAPSACSLYPLGSEWQQVPETPHSLLLSSLALTLSLSSDHSC